MEWARGRAVGRGKRGCAESGGDRVQCERMRLNASIRQERRRVTSVAVSAACASCRRVWSGGALISGESTVRHANATCGEREFRSMVRDSALVELGMAVR